MNVISYTALHYGRDYLYYAIKSVIDHVDKHYVLYTPIGSHGHRTPIPCPETRDELFAIAQSAAGDKLVWVDGVWPYEGAQREHIHVVAPDADVVLVVDADEVWGEGLADKAIRMGTIQYPTVRIWRSPIIHYWRSFYRCVLHDPAFPVRMILPKAPVSDEVFYVDKRQDNGLKAVINHFGYAQRPEIVEYKQHTHQRRNN